MCKSGPAVDIEDGHARYRPAVLLVSFLTCFALHPSTAAGQTVGAMTGAINGTLTDGTGAVLPLVTIVISSPALMGTRTTVTNAEGLYRFPALAPGEYALVFTLDGFRAVRREGIHVAVGFTATVDLELHIATPQENVIVERNSPVIDKQSTAIGATFDARQLADLPSARSMWAIQAATPAVYVARFDVSANATGPGGAFSAYGTAGFNRPMVEGISVTGINPTGFTLDYGAFEEVSLARPRTGPEWHAPGVSMQFVSKSGGNHYRGTVYADLANRDWQSLNIDERQVGRGAQGGRGLSPRGANRLWSYNDINADVGGFIKPDAAWWYFSIRDQEVSMQQVNFPVKPLRTSLTNYTGKTTYQITARDKLVAFAQTGRNHQPTRLDPFGPTGSGVGPATAINESEESTLNQLARGAGCGRASGMRSSMTGCSSRCASASSAPTGRRRRTARRLDSRMSAISSSPAAIATGRRTFGATRCSGPSAISTMIGREATISRSVAKFSAQQRPRSGGELILTTCCTCCGTALQSTRRCSCSRHPRDRKAAYGRIQPTSTTPGG